VVYENPWIRVREDAVVRPDGTPGIYGVVSPVNLATGVLAWSSPDEVVLVGQYRYTLERYSWELPEGGCPAGEAPLAAIQRELAEETGLAAREWRPLGGPLHLSNCFTDEVGHLFEARDLHPCAAGHVADATEVLQVRHVAFAEALAMAEDGRITDAMTVVALLRAARLR
jgi:8-oxo-dGTP pyrophosphatase MutT (NUDIX family)